MTAFLDTPREILVNDTEVAHFGKEYWAAAVAHLAAGLRMLFENDAYPFVDQDVSLALGLLIEVLP